MKNVYLLLLLFCVTVAAAQKDKNLVDETVSQAGIAAHLRFLSSDALEGRDTPSKGLVVAAEYLRTQLQLYGVQPLPEYPDYFQPVHMKKIKRPESGTITVGDQTFQIKYDFLQLSGTDLDWSGDLIVLPYATPAEIAEADVKGKVIVANTGDGTEQNPQASFRLFRDKRVAAKEAGAVALIELYNSPMIPWQMLVHYLSGEKGGKLELDTDEENDSFTYIWMDNSNQITSPVFEKTRTMTVSITGTEIEKFEAYNLVGYIPGTDAALKAEYITYSAHYDHIGIGIPDSTGDAIYNGARDNAIGTVTVLEAAKNMAKYPTKRSSLFILFVGEEKGMLGSKWFVDHSPLPLRQLVYCFNSDGAGYNDTSLATIIGLHRTTAEGQITKALQTYGLVAGDDANYKNQNLFDRSDNVCFAQKGIPAPTFSTGMTLFDEQVMKYYHQPSDEFESLDMDYLFAFYRAYVLAGRLIGNMKETPFWVEGDKYYDAGKALYSTK